MSSKILDLNASDAQRVLSRIDLRLQLASPSKKAVVTIMSEEGLCSAKSTGSEATFYRHAKSLGLAIPPTFAKLMGDNRNEVVTSPLASPPLQQPVPVETPPKPQAAPAPILSAPGESQARLQVEPQSSRLLALKGVSAIVFGPFNAKATVHFPDGKKLDSVAFDESVFRSNSTLIEFSV